MISNKKMDDVISRVSATYQHEALSLLCDHYSDFTKKARNHVIGLIKPPQKPPRDELLDAIDSMMDFWDVFAFGNENNARDMVYSDIVDLYGALYGKTTKKEDMIDLFEDLWGSGWWNKSYKHKELFTLIGKFIYPHQSPSFL
jgi:hypothetical protein